ncbi:hypothetical protein [Pelagibacterium montanilacus]|uniref:hypothetical protein n=1 Tax=Pelagibacterium montanilacus TaxID=2185280 RepID=UPI000F8D5A4D|nr:hypothetical protein [Pelagibacterium montanilacus]
MSALKIYHLIAAHAVAAARLEEAADGIDNTQARQEGREVSEADQAEWDTAEAEEEKAFDALLSHVPEATIELQRKLAYIEIHTHHTETLDRRQCALLFESLMGVRLRAA